MKDQLNDLTLTITPGKCNCGCGATTNKGRSFRQGHDATLKSLLIAVGVRGGAVSGDGGAKYTDAVSFANHYGFGHMVQQGIESRLAKVTGLPARGEYPPVRTDDTVSPTMALSVMPGARVEAKVGRWTYEGVELDGTFTYTNRKGEVVSTTKFEVVL